jgi:plasmid stability protein
MKTTLDLPDEVYRELKIRAAREGATLTNLIASALASALNRPAAPAAPVRQRPLNKRDEQKIREWMEKESAFLESMRGPVFGEGAVAGLLGGRR